MNNEISDLERRMDSLEVKHETLGIITTALLALVQNSDELLLALESATELHDANLLYTTSLSDDQQQRVLAHLKGFSDSLRRRPIS